MTGQLTVSYYKTIVVLAASRKPGGRCLAGRETKPVPGAWIRPVSDRPGAEIELTERRFIDGSEPQLLDTVGIPMLAPAPHLHQTENHLIDARFYWQKTGGFAWDDLGKLTDEPDTLWTNKGCSHGGVNDRVSDAQATGLAGSLFLIRPRHVCLQVVTPRTAFIASKRRVRAEFQYLGVPYNVIVTDPDVERNFLRREDGYYPMKQDAYFCMSLTEPHLDGYCYKLVASILTKEPL